MTEATERPAYLALICSSIAILAASVPSPSVAATSRVDRQLASPPALASAPQQAVCPTRLELLAERALAGKVGLDVGALIQISVGPNGPWCTATVAGIHEPRADPADITSPRPRVLMHLPQLADLLGRTGEVDRFAVRVRPGTNIGVLRDDLDAQLVGAQVVPTDDVIGRASTTFEVVERFHRAIGWITLGAGGAFLACIMILKVQERRLSIAALRLLGTSRRTLMGWLVLEAAIISTAGGMLGIAIGGLASAIINRYYQWSYDTTLLFSVVTPDVVVQALGLALGLGLVAGGAAMFRLLAVHPLEEAGR